MTESNAFYNAQSCVGEAYLRRDNFYIMLCKALVSEKIPSIISVIKSNFVHPFLVLSFNIDPILKYSMSYISLCYIALV